MVLALYFHLPDVIVMENRGQQTRGSSEKIISIFYHSLVSRIPVKRISSLRVLQELEERICTWVNRGG